MKIRCEENDKLLLSDFNVRRWAQMLKHSNSSCSPKEAAQVALLYIGATLLMIKVPGLDTATLPPGERTMLCRYVADNSQELAKYAELMLNKAEEMKLL